MGRREELVKGRLGKVMGAEWRPPRRGGSHSGSGSASCNQGEWKLDKVLGLSGSQLKQPSLEIDVLSCMKAS